MKLGPRFLLTNEWEERVVLDRKRRETLEEERNENNR